MIRKVSVLALVALLVFGAGLTAGCGPKKAREAGKLRIGILPIVDSLPFMVAEEKGYFSEEGVEVELVNFDSALNRDAAFQAGEIDGGVADPLAAVALNASGLSIKIVSLSLGASPEEGRFAILTPPGSAITRPEGLKGVEIAISPNTIIEYVTDQLLMSRGFAPAEIKKQAIMQIPVRFQMLMEGQVEAATLPDPLATLAQSRGANLVIDDTDENISQSVIMFRSDSVSSKAGSIERMFKAYRRAVEDINSSPESYRPLLEEKARLPRGLAEYSLGTYPQPQLPGRADIERVVNWMLEKGIIKNKLSYDELVDDRFVR